MWTVLAHLSRRSDIGFLERTVVVATCANKTLATELRERLTARGNRWHANSDCLVSYEIQSGQVVRLKKEVASILSLCSWEGAPIPKGLARSISRQWSESNVSIGGLQRHVTVGPYRLIFPGREEIDFDWWKSLLPMGVEERAAIIQERFRRVLD